MLSLASAALAYSPASLYVAAPRASPTMVAPWPAGGTGFEGMPGAVPGGDVEATKWTSSEIADRAGLEALAVKLNPTVGYWDPLGIGSSSKEAIAWYRHAEIKHGRVAMAGFVGYVLQANGVCFPWNLQAPIGFAGANLPTVSFADISAAGGPADQWDALPDGAKIQFFGAILFLEMWGESSWALEQTASSTMFVVASQATSQRSRVASRIPCPSICGTRLASPRICRPSARRRPSSPRSTTAASRWSASLGWSQRPRASLCPALTPLASLRTLVR